jgi:hypothetical protein
MNVHATASKIADQGETSIPGDLSSQGDRSGKGGNQRYTRPDDFCGHFTACPPACKEYCLSKRLAIEDLCW